MPGPIDEFCESLRSELHARRAKSHAELEHLHQLVRELAAAREAAFVTEFASPLKLRVPTFTGPTSAAAHARLMTAVQALSEAGLSNDPRPETEVRQPRPSVAPGPVLTPEHASESTTSGTSNARWPTLERLVGNAPVVVVGGSRGEKLGWLPPALRQSVEWIETTRQGTHAIGNLASRIRQRRVLALIVLDGVVGHKHSEPLVAAAREVKIPTAYANKGGTGALARAFTQLEKMVGAP